MLQRIFWQRVQDLCCGGSNWSGRSGENAPWTGPLGSRILEAVWELAKSVGLPVCDGSSNELLQGLAST